MAWRMKQPHWELTDPETARYAQALQKALRHIPVKVSQAAADFTALVVAAGEIDGKRVMLSWALMAPPNARPKGPAQVFPFPQASVPAGPPVSQGKGDMASNAGPQPAAEVAARGETLPEGFVLDGVDAPLGGIM